MTEATFWRKTVRPALGMFGAVHRIENRTELGTPDVVFCRDGVVSFIELKHEYEWPKRAVTRFRFSELKLEQILWAENWTAHGGRCCLLAQVARDYLLFPPPAFRLLYAGASRNKVIGLAAVHQRVTFPTGQVLQWLNSP